jgi:hypothetical protein
VALRLISTSRGRPSLTTVIALAAAMTVALGACSSPARGGPATDGPLTTSTEHGGNCAAGSRLQAFADQFFTNKGRTTVVLDRVVLIHPRDERLIAAYAVPGVLGIGVGNWPPPGGWPPAWNGHRPVRGYRVGPGREFNMVMEVAGATARLATSQGILVYYHDPAGNYVTRNYFAMVIASPGRICT